MAQNREFEPFVLYLIFFLILDIISVKVATKKQYFLANIMKKNILIFSTAYLPLIGGAEIAIKEITDRIGDYSFFLITAKIDPSLASFEKIGNVEVYRVGIGSKIDKFLLPFLGLKKAREIDKRNKINIIWSMMASQASVAAARFKKKEQDKKLLLTLQEGDEELHLKRYVLGIDFLYDILIKPFHDLVFCRADLIQTISTDLKNRARKKNTVCPIEVVPNGVDIEKFSKKISDDEKNKIKKDLRINDNDIVLVHTGRSVKKNNLDDVIRALKLLPDNIKFLMIGSGPDDKKLSDLAEEKGLENSIIKIGTVNHDQMVKYLQVADIFIRPSLSEGLGNSFLEAMVAGLPVVATQVGGIKDFLFDSEFDKTEKQTGFICQVKDPQSIARKVRQIMDEPVKVEAVKKNALEMVKNKFDWNIVARDMNNIFNKIVK